MSRCKDDRKHDYGFLRKCIIVNVIYFVWEIKSLSLALTFTYICNYDNLHCNNQYSKGHNFNKTEEVVQQVVKKIVVKLEPIEITFWYIRKYFEINITIVITLINSMVLIA